MHVPKAVQIVEMSSEVFFLKLCFSLGLNKLPNHINKPEEMAAVWSFPKAKVRPVHEDLRRSGNHSISSLIATS